MDLMHEVLLSVKDLGDDLDDRLTEVLGAEFQRLVGQLRTVFAEQFQGGGLGDQLAEKVCGRLANRKSEVNSDKANDVLNADQKSIDQKATKLAEKLSQALTGPLEEAVEVAVAASVHDCVRHLAAVLTDAVDNAVRERHQELTESLTGLLTHERQNSATPTPAGSRQRDTRPGDVRAGGRNGSRGRNDSGGRGIEDSSPGAESDVTEPIDGTRGSLEQSKRTDKAGDQRSGGNFAVSPDRLARSLQPVVSASVEQAFRQQERNLLSGSGRSGLGLSGVGVSGQLGGPPGGSGYGLKSGGFVSGEEYGALRQEIARLQQQVEIICAVVKGLEHNLLTGVARLLAAEEQPRPNTLLDSLAYSQTAQHGLETSYATPAALDISVFDKRNTEDTRTASSVNLHSRN
ncbi:hypothetical protein GNI_123710 [Gregarina niphandrodes]|uniref:Uncharacterized protein n=1 Tax=Gregarina niphandrodes TaxID=110365 RepID=A0A023B2C9_GRENI|nr:hypothetical protein GNI_123710 [Gregarina niphandrodes]EZG51714.1 hypothetical protein GNI_123710 [Gregarina niphandrodes]|eukprot:XP_011131927.1 hypothetical protein GNI_123710 [Gregarina niphandrodes]